MKISLLIFVLASSALVGSSAVLNAQDANQVQAELKAAFEGKQLQLKVPYVEDKLHFDSKGELLGKSDIGPWTTYGLIRVNQVLVRDQLVDITGNRVILVLDPKERVAVGSELTKEAPNFVALSTERPIRIAVDSGENSAPRFRQSLIQVFQGGDLQARLAAYWTPAVDLTQHVAKLPKGRMVGMLEGNRPVYRLESRSFHPPKPIYTPDPSFPPEAKNKHISGTVLVAAVINEKGFPELLEPTHRTVEGFDDKALSAISRWRFQPATLDGKPTAVLVNVEVSFSTH